MTSLTTRRSWLAYIGALVATALVPAHLRAAPSALRPTYKRGRLPGETRICHTSEELRAALKDGVMDIVLVPGVHYTAGPIPGAITKDGTQLWRTIRAPSA